ncbi:unnamed protein product [Merluccius merluccius]
MYSSAFSGTTWSGWETLSKMTRNLDDSILLSATAARESSPNSTTPPGLKDQFVWTCRGSVRPSLTYDSGGDVGGGRRPDAQESAAGAGPPLAQLTPATANGSADERLLCSYTPQRNSGLPSRSAPKRE